MDCDCQYFVRDNWDTYQAYNAITALFGIPQFPLPRLGADLVAFVTLLAASHINEMGITDTASRTCG